MGAVLLLWGFLLDVWLGDPQGRWHPVVLIGWLISALERVLFPRKRNFRQEFLRGFVLVAVVVGGLGGGYFFFARFLSGRAPLLFWAIELYLIFSFLALSTLIKRGREVREALRRGDLEEARKNLKHLVSRDTEHLSEWEVVRACVESLAENFNDGVIAPLFYMALLGALGGVVYKASNTLDSMVGYKDFRYFFFGFASARWDDVLNFLPARLSVLWIALGTLCVNRRFGEVFRYALRDARKHASPNAGWPEAGMAGALGVRLGGVNYYGGKREETPFLGDSRFDLTAEKIDEAIAIVRWGAVWGIGFLSFLAWLLRG